MIDLPMYRRLFADNGAVGYVSEAASDHVVLYASANPAAEPDRVPLDELIARWSAGAPPRRRTIFFCQRFDLATLPATLAAMNLSLHWGGLSYWSAGVFAAGPPDAVFPNGDVAPIQLGDLRLVWRGGQPSTLDEFTITLDGAANELVLALPSAMSYRIRRGPTNEIAVPSDASLRLALGAPTGFVAGALGASVQWPATPAADHPLRSVGFLFESAPARVPPPEPTRCPTFRAELADTVDAAGERCVLALDPRDNHRRAPWLGGRQNSRLSSGAATLRSSLFSTKGHRLHLRAGTGGVTRLGFAFNVMDPDQSLRSDGSIVFHPEGAFEIVNAPALNAAARDTGIGALDVIAGATATEFFDLESGAISHVHFSQGPAFLDSSDALLIDKNGRVLTSFVCFGNAQGAIVPVTFHSQPARSALFGASGEADQIDHLARQRLPLGNTTAPLPIFPWAGRRTTTGTPPPPFELTHLSAFRRKEVGRATAAALAAAASSDAIQDPVVRRGVTPQGVLAEVATDGYRKLLFGNADSANLRLPEFSIEIKQPDSPIFAEVQQALASSELFLVFDRPDADALAVIEPKVTITIRDFTFSINLTSQASQTDRTVLLVKYFNGKSLEELVDGPRLWALRERLAKHTTPADLERLAHLEAKPELPIPEPFLTDVWRDRNWQGVVALNLVAGNMPSVVEALKPGVIGSLVAHHVGINAPPIHGGDLTSPTPRLGSAFGLLHYAKPASNPEPPAVNDVEPGGSGSGGRAYAFIVKSLDIGFQNGQISLFEAEVRVEFNRLFWDSVTVRGAAAPGGPPPGGDADALTLVGRYERRVRSDNSTEDVFSLQSKLNYVVTFESGSRLARFAITRAQLSVVSRTATALTTFLGIDGDLELSEGGGSPAITIPLFKVHAIHLKGVGFEFVYTPRETPENSTFECGFKADGIAADLEFDPPSAGGSLMELLPVKLKGMSIAIGKLFDVRDLGFTPINFDGIGSAFQFAFALELDLGFLGKLAGEARSLRVPMLLGWRGGIGKGVAFGIQFPRFDGKIDIGIQQFIRLRAAHLNLVPCRTSGGALRALAIQAVDAKVVTFGREWPDAATSFAFFVPIDPSRRVSWALGVKPDGPALKYLGGGHRITLPGGAKGTKAIVAQFEANLGDASNVCALLGHADAKADGWSLVGKLEAGINVWLAIDDARQTYGLVLGIPALGEVDVLYRRVTDELGIFSAEYTLPEALRTIQIGAASLRLPTFRTEVHTDGGVLFDFGFPWQNEFARSAQLEIAIFVGSGGFYYGRTSAAATDLLTFQGGYGFLPPDTSELVKFRALRLGFAFRVGIGRSFSIGILKAEASLTLFGGLEGAAAYPGDVGGQLAPTLYAIRGFVGLMLDIRAEVNFVIIKARASILAYVMVGLEVRRVLAKKNGVHHLVKLPTVIFAEVGLRVEVSVEIRVGCVSITIRLSFSATWRIEETLGSLESEPLLGVAAGVVRARLCAARPDWNTQYRFFVGQRDLEIFVTVLPCMAQAADVGLPGDVKTCAIGQMLLAVRPDAHAFGDLGKFLVGWVIRPETTTGIPDTDRITLATIRDLRLAFKEAGDRFWDGFQAALLTVIDAQFTPVLALLRPEHRDDPFAAMPLWPGVTFGARSTDARAAAMTIAPRFVADRDAIVRGDEAGFANYASCVILATLAEIEQLITDEGRSPDAAADAASPRNDPFKFLTWGEVWTRLLAA